MIDPTWWERLAALEPAEVARRAQARWDPAVGAFRLALAGVSYRVFPRARRVEDADRPVAPVGYAEELALVVYLVQARAIELAGRWVTPEALPGGDFFFRGPHALPTDRLAAAFGGEPSRLWPAVEAMGGDRLAMGDAAGVVPALPRVPMAVVIWRADEEFPARASLLFDATASAQLLLDSLWLLAQHVASRLIALAAGPPEA